MKHMNLIYFLLSIYLLPSDANITGHRLSWMWRCLTQTEIKEAQADETDRKQIKHMVTASEKENDCISIPV